MPGFGELIAIVRFFWIIILPCFAMIFFVRCVDIFACRKFQAKNSRWKIFMLDLCTVAFFQLSVGIIEALLIFKEPAFVILPFLTVPIFSIFVLMITYYFDRKMTKGTDEVRDFLSGSFKSDLAISLSYDVLYGVFFYRYFIMELSWEKSASAESDIKLIVVAAVLFAVGTLCKILNSRRRIGNVKSDLKEE